MTADQQAVRHALFLSLIMITLGSSAAAATKWVATDVSIAAIITVQYCIATLLCLPRILRPGIAVLQTTRWWLHCARGLAGVASFYLFYATLEHIPMLDAMMLRQSAPLLVPLVVWAWTSERIATDVWLPLGIGFAGITIILRPSPLGLSWWHAGGLLGAMGLALSMVATRKLARTEPNARILFYYCIISLACVAPFSVNAFDNLGLLQWLALVYIGVAIYLVLELYTRAYGMAPTATIAPMNYFSVLLAALWGWAFWNQVPDRWSTFGSCLVISGGLLALYRTRAK